MTEAIPDPGHDGTCGANKRSGGTCTLPAGWGTAHVGSGSCRKHGGNTRTHVTAAQYAAAARAAKTYGARLDINPVQALVELMQDSAGAVAWLRDIIAATDPDALVWGMADEVDRGSGEFPGVDVRSAAAPSVWLQQYDKERRFLADVSGQLAKLGLEWDAREAVRRQGAALALVVRDMARRLGHDPQDPAVVAAFRAALNSALGGGVDPERIMGGHLA